MSKHGTGPSPVARWTPRRALSAENLLCVHVYSIANEPDLSGEPSLRDRRTWAPFIATLKGICALLIISVLIVCFYVISYVCFMPFIELDGC